LRVDEQRRRRPFPDAPRLRGLEADLRVVGREATVVRGDEITALGDGDRREEAFPRVGEEAARALLVEPVDLALAQQEDAAQHELGDAVGMLLRVRERERRAPRAAEDLPLRDGEVRAE